MDDKKKSGTRMTPPRLTLVREARETNDNLPEEEIAALEAAEMASAAPNNVAELTPSDRRENLRIIEALLFASPSPLDENTLKRHLKGEAVVGPLIEELRAFYSSRGVNLMKVAGKWSFRTAEDLSYLLERHAVAERKLSKAALETLSIIAYHQPATRAEIEEIRGVQTSPGTLETLMETGWIRPRGRRRAPGRPVTYGTTEAFLSHFGLDNVRDLPGLAELKASGLLDGNLPPGFSVPEPTDIASLMPDEVPLDWEEEPETNQEEMDLAHTEEGLPDEVETDKPDSEAR